MKGIAEFQNSVLTTFANSNLKMIKRIAGEVFADALQISVRREKQGLINCGNATLFTLHPVKHKPHFMELEEVWVGYDGEGSRWSDHMGGQLIDCTGLTITGAINKIVEKINERLHN